MQTDEKKVKCLNSLFYGIVIMYFTLLIFILITRGTVLSLFTNFPSPQRVPRVYNLIPFHSLSTQMSNLRFFNQTVTGNIIMFVPIGIIISCLVNKGKFIVSVIGCVFGSALAEVLQFVLATGACDVDDIITNTIGGIIGALIYALIFYITKRDSDRTKNIITLIAYTFPPFLFSYLRMQTVSMEQLHFDFPDAIVLIVYFTPICLFIRKHLPKHFIIYIATVVCFSIFFYTLFIKYV